MKKEPKFHVFLYTLIIVALLGILSVYFFNFSGLKDRIANLGYTPSSEILALEEKVGFTDDAKVTFRATRPSLESRDEFNAHCQSYDQEISVLGCYTNDRIYLYNIPSESLAAIIPSTAAHEFLHAAWDRLPEAEKNEVSTYLLDVYASHRDMLAADLEIYDDAEQLDELHSRVGVQIADLPDYLETYYAKYFQDQDAVVAFYDEYIAPFNELQDETDSLKAEIDAEAAEIDARTAEYYSRSEALAKAVDEFNNCVAKGSCFNADEYTTRRAELVAEQEALEEMYNDINAAVESYNEKVERYNNNILRTETLQNAINSNAPPSTL